MINKFDFQVGHPSAFAQLAVKERLFLYYKCPRAAQSVAQYAKFNKIFFVLDGRKTFRHRDKSWEMTAGKAFLIGKTDYAREMFEGDDLDVICFYIPDAFL